MAAMSTPRGTETVVVVGAGIIGAACAEALSARGIPVTVLDRGGIAAGTTSRCEGNVLVSDKPAGPELDLVRASRAGWPALLARIEASDDVEWEDKGGLVVATDDDTAAALAQFVAAQRGVGVSAQSIDTRPPHPPRAGSRRYDNLPQNTCDGICSRQTARSMPGRRRHQTLQRRVSGTAKVPPQQPRPHQRPSRPPTTLCQHPAERPGVQ
jgi:glycine/D-amino acid oxidase-like deaminating enzyme